MKKSECVESMAFFGELSHSTEEVNPYPSVCTAAVARRFAIVDRVREEVFYVEIKHTSDFYWR